MRYGAIALVCSLIVCTTSGAEAGCVYPYQGVSIGTVRADVLKATQGKEYRENTKASLLLSDKVCGHAALVGVKFDYKGKVSELDITVTDSMLAPPGGVDEFFAEARTELAKAYGESQGTDDAMGKMEMWKKPNLTVALVRMKGFSGSAQVVFRRTVD